jgi:hypothetical protein
MLTTSTPDVRPGQAVSLHVTGQPNALVQLFCYSRPGTTYLQVRPNAPGQGEALSSAGNGDYALFPGTNTRCAAQYLNEAASRSGSVASVVHTALSLSAYRDGPLTYHFQGRDLPTRAGQLITLYRIDATGTEIRTATTVTNATGIWRIDRTFTGTGLFTFVAKTTPTLNNGAGKSNVRPTVVH